MENETPMPEGAQRVHDLEECVVSQQVVIQAVVGRMDTTDDNYLKLAGILQKSVVKIDEPKLGLN